MKPIGCFMVTVVVALVVSLANPHVGWAAKKGNKRHYRITAKSALLYEAGQGKKLYDKNSGEKILPASTTKVMTALLVLENIPLDRWVTVSANATKVAPSKINLVAGEQYRVGELLYAILINSANDASVVLAEAVAGSHGAFVKMMNKRAGELGAQSTLFANAHGLPSEAPQYTTAQDMCLIFSKALERPFFKRALGYSRRNIRSRDGRKIVLKTHNTALKNAWKKKIHGKTGYTNKARACFVGYLSDEGRSLIVGVFGCTKRWEDVRYLFRKYAGVSL